MYPHYPSAASLASSCSHTPIVDAARLDFLRDVQRGLSNRRKELQCKYFYDERGSELFDQICQLEEYYPTRIESEIMHRHAGAMAHCIGSDAVIVEYGSGSSTKTRYLLEQLTTPKAYLPVDISEDYLLKVASQLREDYPALPVTPIVADFTIPFDLPHFPAKTKVCVYFPGSTIGNLESHAARILLRQIEQQCRAGGGLLLGIDLAKDAEVLRRAYDDSQGITAAFNLNLLHRINREFGADFDVEQFAHVAEINERDSRVEMYLESLCEQTVHLADRCYRFASGERIFTEYSHKYRLDDFVQMAAECGLELQQLWTDPQQYFAVVYLTRSGSRSLSSAQR